MSAPRGAGERAVACTLLCVGLAASALCPESHAAGMDLANRDPQASPAPPTVADQVARAVAYEHGEGVSKDEKLAAALYCDAAVRGSAEAAFQLGWMYANGRGVPRDDGIASALLQLAAGEGHAFARTALEHVAVQPAPLPECMRPIAPPTLADAAPEPVDDAPDPFAELPPGKRKIADEIARLAPHYGIDPRLALSVVAVESNFERLATSPRNGQGLMQLIPETAARFNVRDPYDARENLRGGLSYLRWLLSYYRGDVALTVAAYNAGERSVDRYRGVPPFPETRAYVRRVLDLFRRDRHRYDPAVTKPSIAASHLSPGSD